MKPTDEKSGVRQQRRHKDFGCPPTPASLPDAIPDEAAVFDAVYTLLGDMAATIGQAARIQLRGSEPQAIGVLKPAKSIKAAKSPAGDPGVFPDR